MASAQKFQQFAEDVYEQAHDLGADSLKVSLHNTAPVVTNSIWANLTEIAAGSGYTATGDVVAQTSSVHATGTYKLVLTDNTWTSSGTIGPFRYPVLYNDTQTSPADPLILFWDYSSSITLNDGETFQFDQDQGGLGVLTHV